MNQITWPRGGTGKEMDRAYSSFKAAWSKIDLNQSERNPNNDTLYQKK